MIISQMVKSRNIFNLRNDETMLQLVEKMIKKTKADCADALRLYVMFVNGAASVNLSNGQYADAVLLYRSVLAKMKFYHDIAHDNFQVCEPSKR